MPVNYAGNVANKPLVCYDNNLYSPKVKEWITSASGSTTLYDDLMNGGCTTQEVCDKVYNSAYALANAHANQLFGELKCEWAQAVAVDMLYHTNFYEVS